jgi:hypothetical protein
MEVPTKALVAAVKRAVFEEQELTIQQRARVFMNVLQYLGEGLMARYEVLKEEKDDDQND